MVDKESDLSDWLLVGNPRLRHIPVAKPDHHARRALAPALLRGLAGAQDADAQATQQAQQAFVDDTEGMLLLDLNAIAQLARVEGVPLSQVADAVRRYKVGVTEDPWLKIDRNRIRGASEFISRRVKGQGHAATHMLDIVKRAMTGVGGGRRGGRPRGVAFLAGPTGVGKTELAKTITSLLFGDESAYIRFDMSEFSAEHADQRLMAWNSVAPATARGCKCAPWPSPRHATPAATAISRPSGVANSRVCRHWRRSVAQASRSSARCR
ncbi:AAA family ATPase [Cupriavidus sp. CuC1]|uniref:AAA family ATPase n=1 Tax=Cupriavidus sp. CuC1 TaxID=3373131 RepID=UPI0037D91B47